MTKQNTMSSDPHSQQMPAADPPFGSSALRLGTKQWVSVVLVTGTILFALPRVWERLEPLADEADDRMPYAQSEDYWLYARRVAKAGSWREIAVIGDSVVWGEYVTPQQTLSHYLNQPESQETDDSPRFVNRGLNGIHPLALQGLISHYATALHDEQVLLHCNLLWMSSPERDLQVEKELSFNHARLVPQLTTDIPCYKASLAERMGIVVDRNLAVRGWAQHLRIAYFDGQDIPNWTLEHPYENPLAQIQQTRAGDNELRHTPVPWFEQGISVQDLPWVKLDTSLQWQAFRRTVECLESRGNRVFVVVGPLNVHMLSAESRRRLRSLRSGVARWLSERNIPHTLPAPLPSDEYADSSHPLGDGYRRLAEIIQKRNDFQKWLGG